MLPNEIRGQIAQCSSIFLDGDGTLPDAEASASGVPWPVARPGIQSPVINRKEPFLCEE